MSPIRKTKYLQNPVITGSEENEELLYETPMKNKITSKPFYTTTQRVTERIYYTSKPVTYGSSKRPPIDRYPKAYPRKDVISTETSYRSENKYEPQSKSVDALEEPLYGKIETYIPEPKYNTEYKYPKQSYPTEDLEVEMHTKSYKPERHPPSPTTYSTAPKGEENSGYSHPHFEKEEPKYYDEKRIEHTRPKYHPIQLRPHSKVHKPVRTIKVAPYDVVIASHEIDYKPHATVYKPYDNHQGTPEYKIKYKPLYDSNSYHPENQYNHHYHHPHLPTEIDIGYGYKLKLVYKPRKPKTYKLRHSPPPSRYIQAHSSPQGEYAARTHTTHVTSYEKLKYKSHEPHHGYPTEQYPKDESYKAKIHDEHPEISKYAHTSNSNQEQYKSHSLHDNNPNHYQGYYKVINEI